jgi:hypothetical protein
MTLPSAKEVLYGLLRFTATLPDHARQPDGVVMVLSLPERHEGEPMPILLEDFVRQDVIRSWGLLQPFDRAFAHGNAQRQHRACVFVTTDQYLALLQEQAGGPGPAE